MARFRSIWNSFRNFRQGSYPDFEYISGWKIFSGKRQLISHPTCQRSSTERTAMSFKGRMRLRNDERLIKAPQSRLAWAVGKTADVLARHDALVQAPWDKVPLNLSRSSAKSGPS